jgi:DNA-binding CsgD family transcriptional regulator
VTRPPVIPERQLLTVRETECIRLAALGLTTLESARELGLAPRTVEFHLTNAMRKLGAPNKIRAVVIAVQQNLISESPVETRTHRANSDNEAV